MIFLVSLRPMTFIDIYLFLSNQVSRPRWPLTAYNYKANNIVTYMTPYFNSSLENFQTCGVGKDKGFKFYQKIFELTPLLYRCHKASALIFMGYTGAGKGTFNIFLDTFKKSNDLKEIGEPWPPAMIPLNNGFLLRKHLCW